ncbi:hypothetical protein SAMN04488028_103394 [Reichenbachiella agariperforans]|uniref:Uncharacterized protein n=1 Tax=Reichenbachiella agariperforans TaxID=156994 RepID=A0A1M6QN95_REIAG|nr:hypothetical protein SAMN04488028_103394 [Reichenbachiella agariperforans]
MDFFYAQYYWIHTSHMRRLVEAQTFLGELSVFDQMNMTTKKALLSHRIKRLDKQGFTSII